MISAQVEDQVVFHLEKQLVDFLVHNRHGTVLGRECDLYEEYGQPVGQQYPTDTRPMDALAISKDKI
ncbi:hypothetical protein [Glutamicibacter arilaitensis]|uniref:hypothetical protein n=1 Tax=Glutamicibacter arilaitensis TaxID=256701 RepID=UPI00384B0F67